MENHVQRITFILFCLINFLLLGLLFLNYKEPKALETLGAIILLLVLLFVNRDREKILGTLLTIFFVAIVGLAIFLKPCVIKKDICSAYFFSYEKNELVFFKENKSFDKHFKREPWILGSAHKEQELIYDGKTLFDSIDRSKALIDLLSMSILEHLQQYYYHHWYGELRVMRGPAFITRGIDRKEIPKFAQNDIMTYDKTNWPKSFEKNIFFPHLNIKTITDSITVPKETKISYKLDGPSHRTEIRFNKPFWFDVRLNFKSRGSLAGLGHLTNILVPESVNDITFDETYKRQSAFQTHQFEIECKATFNRFRVGDPKMLAYREWVEGLFNELHRAYDWELFEKQIYDQRHQDATEAILRMAGAKDHN